MGRLLASSSLTPGGGFILDKPDEISFFHLVSTIGALRLECAGLKMSRGRSVYAFAKKQYNLKGNKQRVLEQLIEIKNKRLEARSAD